MLCHDVCCWVRRIDARIMLHTSVLWAGGFAMAFGVSSSVQGGGQAWLWARNLKHGCVPALDPSPPIVCARSIRRCAAVPRRRRARPVRQPPMRPRPPPSARGPPWTSRRCRSRR